MGSILAISSMVVNYIPVSTGSTRRRYAALDHGIEPAVLWHSVLKGKVTINLLCSVFIHNMSLTKVYSSAVVTQPCRSLSAVFKLQLIADHTKLSGVQSVSKSFIKRWWLRNRYLDRWPQYDQVRINLERSTQISSLYRSKSSNVQHCVST